MKRILTIASLILTPLVISGCKAEEEGKKVNCNIDPFNAACVGDTFEATGADNYYDGPSINWNYLNAQWVANSGAIRQVTVLNKKDGDTTDFLMKNNGTQITVRYLGIDTPETYPTAEPWGEAGKKYTNDYLDQAEEVYVQIETSSGMVDTYGRTLGYVWIKLDGKYVLLNYLVAKAGYSRSSAGTNTMYYKYMAGAEKYAIKNKLRFVGGQTDPNFNYTI